MPASSFSRSIPIRAFAWSIARGSRACVRSIDMPAIDRFLGVMQSQHASVLQLAAEQPACLDVSGGASRAITRQPLTGAQVHALLREMAPAESAQALESGTTALFTYRAD